MVQPVGLTVLVTEPQHKPTSAVLNGRPLGLKGHEKDDFGPASPIATSSSVSDGASSDEGVSSGPGSPKTSQSTVHRQPADRALAAVISSKRGEAKEAPASLGGGTGSATEAVSVPQGAHDDLPLALKAPRVRKIYGRLPKFSPFLGTFQHAPGAGNRSRSSFFEQQLVREEDRERQKRIKANPFTGTFHFFPGRYSALHGLQRFRHHGRFRSSFDELDRLEAMGRRVSQQIEQSSNPKAASFMAHMFAYAAPVTKRRTSLYPHRSRASLEPGQWGPLVESMLLDNSTGCMRYRYGGAVDMLRKFGASLDDGCLANTSSAYRDILHRWNGFRLYYHKTHPHGPSRADSFFNFHQRPRMATLERAMSMSSMTTPLPPNLSTTMSHAGPPPSSFIREERSNSFAAPAPVNPAFTSTGGYRSLRGPAGPAPGRRLTVKSGGAVELTKSVGGDGGMEFEVRRAQSWAPWGGNDSSVEVRRAQSYVQGRSVSPTGGGGMVPPPSPAPSDGSLTSQRFQLSDKYNIRTNEVLGEGSFATVVGATYKETGQQVAIKAIKRRYLFTEEEKASVRNEIDNMARVAGHRNVVRLFEVFETPEHIYLVVERATHGSLEQILQLRRKLTELETMWVTKQLLDAIEYLHSNGVLHCDIKPHNILFSDVHGAACLGLGIANTGCSNGDTQRKMWLYTSPLGMILKLCDFGLSRKVPDVRYFKHTGDINRVPFSRVCGTGGYIAPEIIQKKSYGKPADMWSVGVVTYRMLSAAMPFIPPAKCLEQPVSFRGRVWDQVSQDAKAFSRGLLEVDQSRRKTAREALGHKWMQTVPEWGPEVLLGAGNASPKEAKQGSKSP